MLARCARTELHVEADHDADRNPLGHSRPGGTHQEAVALLVGRGSEGPVPLRRPHGRRSRLRVLQHPSYFVFGNCDYDPESLREAIAIDRGDLPGAGGLDRPWRTVGSPSPTVILDESSTVLQRSTPDYLFSGHTHQLPTSRKGPTALDQPGCPPPRIHLDSRTAGSCKQIN